MNFGFYVEKLKNSSKFKKFIEKNKDSYFCSAFVALDEKIGNQIHVDYFLPSDNKIVSFQLENGVEQVLIDYYNEKFPEKIGSKYDFDFGEVEKLVEGKMIEEGVKEKIQKILLSLQSLEKKNYLIVTAFVSKLGLIKMKISLPERKVGDFEKKSLFDRIKVLKRDEKKEN